MPLTEYDELTGAQKISVTKMYADLSNLRDYLYNWDDKGYHGRRPKPKQVEPPKESPKVEVPPPPPEEPKPIDEKKDALQTPAKPKATRRRRRTTKK